MVHMRPASDLRIMQDVAHIRFELVISKSASKHACHTGRSGCFFIPCQQTKQAVEITY